MKCLEQDLIKNTLVGNKKEALLNYQGLIAAFQHCFSDSCKLRSMRNYLVCLNCILYKSCFERNMNQGELLDRRNEFVIRIDQSDNVESLDLLGSEIICFYVNLNIDTYSTTPNPIVNQALDYMHNNFSNDLSLEKVSKQLYISRSHLSNLFLLHTGYSFSSYLNLLKIESAKRLLCNSDDSLVDIAFLCGFNSQSYFSSTFKKVEGLSPLQYRKTVK